MNVSVVTDQNDVADVRTLMVDADIHPMLRSLDGLHPYLATRWREHLQTYGNHLRQPFPTNTAYPRAARALSRQDAWPPSGGPPGSDLEFMRTQHLDPNGVELGVLQTLFPHSNTQRNLEFSAAMCSAINDWQLAEWIEPEPRLRASLMVPHEDPDAAVAEIDRRAGNPAFVQVVLTPRSAEPLGRKRYWPIYQAAAEYGLPIGLHSSGINGYAPTGSGWPSFFIEENHTHWQSMQALVTSFVMEGVFERFPKLKVVLVEGGWAWAPSLHWRLDKLWQRLRSEVPHVKRPPSEYIREHVWFTTQPMEEAEHNEDLRITCEWIGWDRLLFATDYPHWDFDDPQHAFPIQLTAAERRRVFHDNAYAAFRLA
jgi:uncharacterized protein